MEPKARCGLIYTRVYLCLVRHIHADADCGFLIAQFACRLRGFGRIEIGDDDAAVGFHIAFRNRVADAACCAGDQSNFAVELHDTYSLKGREGIKGIFNADLRSGTHAAAIASLALQGES